MWELVAQGIPLDTIKACRGKMVSENLVPEATVHQILEILAAETERTVIIAQTTGNAAIDHIESRKITKHNHDDKTKASNERDPLSILNEK